MRNVGIAIGFALLLGGAWFFLAGDMPVLSSGLSIKPAQYALSAASIETVPAPPLGPTYTNDTFDFTLQMPPGYRVQELTEDSVTTITIQDNEGNGVQILVQPYEGSSRVLTSADIQRDIPGMQITDVQEVEIGDDYTGVAFLSDNEAFGGASREVWFFFKGNLYQISTYARLDPLLQSMFGTWQFF